MSIRSLYIPHGGGPMPLLGDPGHLELTEYLTGLEAEIGRPTAIVLVSAHWEEPAPTVTTNPNPDLYFDYYGFPPETYEYTYPAPGSVELADKLAGALRTAGHEPRMDAERGFDHGMFVPMMLMYPMRGSPLFSCRYCKVSTLLVISSSARRFALRSTMVCWCWVLA